MTYSNPKGYEQFMGRWSARLAPLFVRFAGIQDGQRITAQGTRDWIEAAGLDQQQFTDASHWPMIDRPQETAQAIASFYENL